MTEPANAGIAANINAIHANLPPARTEQAARLNIAALNLLETFLINIADIAEAHRPQVMLAEQPPELSDDLIAKAFGTPIVSTIGQPYPKQLAAELSKLCCAETEGRFFNAVTDNIQTIIAALNAYVPEPEKGALMQTPKEGTKAFKAPVSDQTVKWEPLCANPECNSTTSTEEFEGLCIACWDAGVRIHKPA